MAALYPSAMADQTLTANGEPAEVVETTEGFGTTFYTLAHAETGEELGTVEEGDMPESHR